MGSSKKDGMIGVGKNMNVKTGERKCSRRVFWGLSFQRGWSVKIIMSHRNAHKSTSIVEEDLSNNTVLSLLILFALFSRVN